MGEPLTKSAYFDLVHMLSDLDFCSKLFMNEGKTARHKDLKADGSIVLGKTKCDTWNRITNDRAIVSVNDICLKLISEISGKGNTRNREAFDGLTKDFIDKALRQQDYSKAISRIFVAYRINYVGDDLEDESEKRMSGNTHIYQKNSDEVVVLCRDGLGSLSAWRSNIPSLSAVLGKRIQ